MNLEKTVAIQEDMIFEVSKERNPASYPLKTYEWAIITQLNGEKTVRQVAEILALTQEETSRYFEKLSNHGLLELVAVTSTQKRIPHGWYDELTYQLTYAVGPVAGIILEDCLVEMGRTSNSLEHHTFINLVDWVSKEISNTQRKCEFLQKMIDFIQSEQDN